MPVPPRESIRGEAARCGVSLYRVRVNRGLTEGLTARTSVGHGELPIVVARGVEKQRRGNPRALKITLQEDYRREIVAYERRRYGSLITAVPKPRRFDSLEQARMWAEMNGLEDVLETYGEVVQVGDKWEVRMLR